MYLLWLFYEVNAIKRLHTEMNLQVQAKKVRAIKTKGFDHTIVGYR